MVGSGSGWMAGWLVMNHHHIHHIHEKVSRRNLIDYVKGGLWSKRLLKICGHNNNGKPIGRHAQMSL